MKINKNKIKSIKEFIILIIIALTIKTCLIEIYVVPTGSMEKTILIGDMLFGNKFIYGMKTPTWIGIPYTRIGFDIPWFRFPKFRSVRNDDVVIFEFPRDPFQKYVKRCIGIPGDIVKIDNGNIYVNNTLMEFPDKGQYLKKLPDGSEVLSRNITWNSNLLYQQFKAEDHDDTNKNNIKDINESFIDKNNNQRWDYGNIDNFKEFTVPYSEEVFNDENGNLKYDEGELFIDKNNNGIWNKGYSISLDDIVHWESFITMLLLDGNDIQLDEWEMTLIDPDHISRLRGLIKYKFLGLFKSNDNKTRREMMKSQQLEQTNYASKLINENNQRYLINPWDERIKEKINNKNYVLNNLKINDNNINILSIYEFKHDYYFMMGDNRDNSYDSRFWGFVPDYNILGVPIFSIINIANFKFKMKIVK